MSVAGAWTAVFLMMILVIYGQIVLKIRITAAGQMGEGAAGLASFLVRLLLDPWVWTCLAAGFIGGLCWMAALSRLSLSIAYPFAAVMIAGVLVANAMVFGEPIRLLHVVGVGLIALGLLSIAQA